MEMRIAVHLINRNRILKSKKRVHYVFVNNCQKSFLF